MAGMTSFGGAVQEDMVADERGFPGVRSRTPGGFPATLRLHSPLSLRLGIEGNETPPDVSESPSA